MDKEKVDQLKKILKGANSRDPKTVREEAKEFLGSINANELVMAEQAIMNEGVKPEEMGRLCAAHLEMMEDNIQGIKEKLPEDHPIQTLVLEHEEILKFLDELESLNKKMQEAKKFTDLSIADYEKLQHIGHHLEAAEKHHKREEDVLFPAIEAHGVFGPPQMMVEEHKDLRALKKGLNSLASGPRDDFGKYQRDLNEIAGELVQYLRDHIFKENNILYPTALDVLPKDEWTKIKEDADKIGYCCFTPKYLKK